MKYNIIFMLVQLFIFTIIISSGLAANKNILPSSPFGPFDLVFKQVYNCNPTKSNKIQHNIYISHRGNSSWLLGNSTLEVPLDDTFFGPYKYDIKQIFNCNPTKNNTIQTNMYVSKQNNHTLLFGNSTFEEPIDDTLFLEIKMAVKDSLTGSWKENVLSHKMPKACSSLKKILGDSWNAFMHGIGIKNTDCPVLPGSYISPGFDPIIIEKSNIQKLFFYGTYKLHFYYTRKNEIFGCQALILEIRRP